MKNNMPLLIIYIHFYMVLLCTEYVKHKHYIHISKNGN